MCSSDLQSVVPIVNAANQVSASDMAIGHQRPPVQTPAIEHGNLVIETDDDKVNFAYQSVFRRPILQHFERRNRYFSHFRSI